MPCCESIHLLQPLSPPIISKWMLHDITRQSLDSASHQPGSCSSYYCACQARNNDIYKVVMARCYCTDVFRQPK
jgi:hypothetical protein